MKILFLTNNENTKNLIEWLNDEAKEEVLVIDEKITEEMIQNHGPDFLISYNYRYIIGEDVLKYIPNRAINLHASLLPWNKGAYPNVWSFLEETPKGVTIHVIDKGLDTGDILLQKEVTIDEAKETLASSYEKTQKELQELFKENWNRIKTQQIKPVPQPTGGSKHYVKDFEKIKHILGEEGWDLPILEFKKKYDELKGKI